MSRLVNAGARVVRRVEVVEPAAGECPRGWERCCTVEVDGHGDYCGGFAGKVVPSPEVSQQVKVVCRNG
jgi:hypothetical protein